MQESNQCLKNQLLRNRRGPEPDPPPLQNLNCAKAKKGNFAFCSAKIAQKFCEWKP